MSKDSRKTHQKPPLQFRIVRDDPRGAELAAKIEKIAEVNSLSVNDVANLAVAAGLAIVTNKLREIHEPQAEPQAA